MEIHNKLNWQKKKILGDQFLMSSDSIGANIAEGYGRYHYLDKIKFYYNARDSLLESRHWLELFFERQIITKVRYERISTVINNLIPTLNGLINSNYKLKNNL